MVKIFIDPGHGGKDAGAVALSLKEKDLTLAISKELKNILDDYQGTNVKLSRTTDKTVSLNARTDAANKWGADLFISIHINAGGGTGFESYIYNRLSKSSKTNKWRNVIHKEVMNKNRLKDRGKKYANYHVLRETVMHALLTENGFIDTKSNANLMKQNAWIKDVAAGHANGIVQLFNLKKSSSSTQKGNYHIKKALKGYYTAKDAKQHTNPRTNVLPGSYFIYKKAEGMINVTKQEHTPGSWINPADTK